MDTSELENEDSGEETKHDELALIPTSSQSSVPDESPASHFKFADLQDRPGLWTGVAIGLFIVKVMSLFQLCSPYLPSATIMWPLLALAGADVLL
jgi:hypothetical protein